MYKGEEFKYWMQNKCKLSIASVDKYYRAILTNSRALEKYCEKLKDIYNSFQYVEGKDEPPIFNFDLSFINLGKITIKMDFFDEYRNTFFTYMKIFFSITTVYAVLNELKHVIGGGD